MVLFSFARTKTSIVVLPIHVKKISPVPTTLPVAVPKMTVLVARNVILVMDIAKAVLVVTLVVVLEKCVNMISPKVRTYVPTSPLCLAIQPTTSVPQINSANQGDQALLPVVLPVQIRPICQFVAMSSSPVPRGAPTTKKAVFGPGDVTKISNIPIPHRA